MRKLITVLAIITLCFNTAIAETHYKPHISIGGRAGMTMSQMSFSPSVKQGWAQGTTGAVTFRYTEEKLFGLIAEIGWTQRGWKEDFEEFDYSYSRSITYINIPLLTHIYFGSRRFKTFINLGPQFAFYVSDKIDANFNYRDPLSAPGFPKDRMTEQLYDDITGKLDYGICGSIGWEFYVKPRHSVSLEARFYYGLGNIFPSSKADTFGASRNMSLEVTVGYNFRLR